MKSVDVRPVCVRCHRWAELDQPTLVWHCPCCHEAVTDQLARSAVR